MYLIPKTMKKRNVFTFGLFFDVLSYLFLACLCIILGLYSFWKAKEGIGDIDTAFFLDVIDNTLKNGLPTTSAIRAFLNAFPLFGMTSIRQYCTFDFAAVANSDPYNVLIGHAYLIVYPLSAISYFVGPEFTAAMVNIFSFVGLPLISYIYLRKAKIPSYLAFLFVIVLCAHPAWRIASAGWFYFDRLFMPLALWYALSLYGPIVKRETLTRSQMIGIALIVVAGTSIHERAAALLLLFSLSSLILYKGVPKKNIFFVLSISLGLFIYICIYLLFQNNVDNHEAYKSFLSFNKVMANIFRPGLIKLILFNLVFLLVAIIFQWRVALIALITLVPNVIVSIGGAEKDGWLTHYHSFYFPFVVYAGLVGVVSFYKWCHREPFEKNFSFYHCLPACFMFLVCFVMCFQNPYGPTIDWDYKYAKEGLFTPLNDLYVVPSILSSNLYESARADKLVGLIPKGASVAETPPFNTWKLFRNNNPISLFPMGIGTSDYLLLSFDNGSDGPLFKIFSASPDYKQLQKCVADKVWAAGYKEISHIDQIMLLRRSD
ncbi:MAG: hypothetical protein JWQ10_118 [Herbaspirillum sp.]|nr:hypothetical protein [Herbaspirillum sp.]